MAWTIYRSSDSGAPTLNGQAGKILDLLDAVLINGYGSKAAAGWSTAFTSSTKRVYRPGASARARMYYRFLQDTGWYYASYVGYTSMSDIDTGTDPFPSSAYPGQTADFNWLVASFAVDSTTRTWLIAADDRTAIIFIKPQTGSRWYIDYIGEFESYAASDAYQAMVAGTGSFGPPSTISGCALGCVYHDVSNVIGTASLAFRNGIAIARNYDGTGSAIRAGWLNHFPACGASSDQFGGNIGGRFPGANPADSRIWISHIPLYTETTPYTIRGQLRGLYLPTFRHNSYTDGDIFQVVSSSFSGSSLELSNIDFTVMSVTGASEEAGDTARKSTLILQTSGTPKYT